MENVHVFTATLTEVKTRPFRIPPGTHPISLLSAAIVDKLTNRSEDFKFLVTVIILEKKNGGFHLFSTCYWDQEQDGTVTVRWDNPTMHCIVTVFGVTLP